MDSSLSPQASHHCRHFGPRSKIRPTYRRGIVGRKHKVSDRFRCRTRCCRLTDAQTLCAASVALRRESTDRGRRVSSSRWLAEPGHWPVSTDAEADNCPFGNQASHPPPPHSSNADRCATGQLLVIPAIGGDRFVGETTCSWQQIPPTMQAPRQ